MFGSSSSAVELGETLSKAAKAKNIDVIIAGHSPLMKPADIVEYAQLHRDFVRAVRDAKKAGKTIDEVAASWKMPEQCRGYQQPQAAALRNTVQIVFDEIK